MTTTVSAIAKRQGREDQKALQQAPKLLNQMDKMLSVVSHALGVKLRATVPQGSRTPISSEHAREMEDVKLSLSHFRSFLREKA
jgi:hypothetical protein